MTNDQYEERARAAGWQNDPEDSDQWKHAVHPGTYWDACDIPADISNPIERPNQ